MSLYGGSPFEPGNRVLSRPIPVHWAGWRTTTLDLQHAEWKLFIQMNHFEHKYQLAMHHDRMKLSAVSYEVAIPLGHSLAHNFRHDDEELPVFNVVHVAQSIMMAQHVSNDCIPWTRIDATPQIQTVQLRDLRELCHFAKHDPGKELFVQQANKSVLERLEEIIREQEPLQKEIRASMQREPATVTPIRTLLAVA